MNIGSLEVLLGVNTAGLSRASVNMRRFESQVLGSNSRMQSSMQQLGSKMMLTGTLMTQYLTVPISLFAGASVKAFADYESSMGKMAALTSFTGDQIKMMSTELLKMSGKVGASPKNLAEGLYFIGSSGITDTALAMDVLTKSANASRIGLGEVKVVADLVTSVMNAYGQKVYTTAQITDKLTAAVKLGKGESDAFARNIGKVLPLAVQLGVNLDNVFGSIATLTLSGKSAAEAATQIGRLFTTLIQQPPRAEAALNAVGISFAKLREVLRTQGMLGFVTELKNMVGDNKLDIIETTKAYEDNITVLGDVFTNIRALLPVLDMMGPNFQNLKTVLAGVNDSFGSLDAGIAVVAMTVKDRWNRAVGSMQSSLIRFGEAMKEPIIGLIQSFARFIENLANWFTSLSSSTQQMIIKFAGLLAILGPVALLVGQFAGLIRVLGVAVTYLIPIIQAAWVALSTNPLGALAMALSTVIALWNIWYQNSLKGTATQQALNNINQQALQNTLAEKVALESLVRLANNENATKEMKKSAIAQINAISPEYLGSITQETLRTGEATLAIQEYMRNLTLKARMQAVQANMVELERKRLSDVSSGSDKQLSWMDKTAVFTNTLMSSLYGQFNRNTLDKFWTEQETANAAGSRKVYNQLLFFYKGLESDLQSEMAKMNPPVMLQGVSNMTEAEKKAAELKAKLEEASKASAKFWKEYASMDNAKKMQALNEKMLDATGKELTMLARKWYALEQIRLKQEELINQAKAQFDTTPIKPIQAKGVSSVDKSWTNSDGSQWQTLNPVGNDTLKMIEKFNKLLNLNPIITKQNLFANSVAESQALTDIINKTNTALSTNAEKATLLGAGYSQAGADITTLQSALDSISELSVDQLKMMTPEQLEYMNQYLILLDEAKKKQEGSIKSLQAWRNLFSSFSSLMGNVSQYLGESFQKVWNSIQNGIQIISDVIGVIKAFKAIMTVTNAVQATTATIQAANTVATAAGIPVTLAAAAAEEVKATASTNAAIAGAAASTSWIPIVGVGLAIAGVIALMAVLSANKRKATGMATGGMVPSGFPNDSFPAMLTSGETVIPLNRVSEIFGKGQGKAEQKQVVFKIHRKELVGILESASLTGRSF